MAVRITFREAIFWLEPLRLGAAAGDDLITDHRAVLGDLAGVPEPADDGDPRSC